jgi:hypothetical protein
VKRGIVCAARIGLIVVVLCSVLGCAQGRKAAQRETSAPVAFQIVYGEPPSVISVPVTFHGRDYAFIIDTGSSLTVYDSFFKPHLGELVDTNTANMGAGKASLPLYHAPKARVGHLSLQSVTPVGCTDLSVVREAVRQVSGQEIYGIIGMDFLRNHVLRIDFEKKTLCFSSPGSGTGEDLGQRFDIDLHSEGVPTILAKLSKDIEVPFLLDTGDASTGDLEAELFERLRAEGAVEITGSARCATGSGYRETWEGRLNRLALGPYRHDGLRLYKSHWNGLGLGYLARYSVTFDFPNSAVYLKPN